MTEFTVSLKSTRFIGAGVYPQADGESSATERQERLPHFVQAKRNSLSSILIGAGGIGSEVGVSEVRKGLGHLSIFDPDIVELSNLNRQRFFREDLYKNKAERLGKNLAREATSRCLITAYPMRFQEAIEAGLNVDADITICGVDNNEARVAAARYFLETIPVIFIAVSEDADHGYVFVQEPGKACYGCLFPDAVDDTRQYPCSPAIIDILKTVAGIATYAVDTLIMNRIRNWNYKEIFLSGMVPERNVFIRKREKCPICADRR
ncbi:ThiF family adenylyltransferase [Chloroflexota bacterium]